MNFCVKNIFSSLYVYGLPIFLIMGWWYFAFHFITSTTTPQLNSTTSSSFALTNIDRTLLSPIKREVLKEALSGNSFLMAKLMADWEIDAQILESKGYLAIEKMPRHKYVRGQEIGRILRCSEPQELAILRQKARRGSIIDCKGEKFSLEKAYTRFLPQTYTAASILLALTSTDQIVALPNRLRNEEQLYPKSLTNLIPLDIDRFDSEKLYQAHPEVAFVASYSHPATIQALKNQGIALYTMKNIETFQDVTDEIMNIGHFINRPLEAELMSLFIEAAMKAIDNRLALIHYEYDKNKLSPRILFLNYHQSFSIPTTKTLTGKLLHKIGILAEKNQQQWSFPIDKERLVNLNPDCLVISTENSKALEKELYSDWALKNLSAIRNNRLFFVDDVVQQTPTQYVVLAYHDLIQVLENLP